VGGASTIVAGIMSVVAIGASCVPNANAVDGPALPPRPKIIPWVECNWPDAPVDKGDPSSKPILDHVIEGLLIWQRVTDTAIVSIMPGQTRLYHTLHSRVPGMRIIPGLKTMTLLDRLDSESGWQAIANEVLAIAAATGERVVLLENEKAVYPFIRDKRALDTNRLRKALDRLPKDMDYLWYPSIFGKEAEQKRGAEVCRAVEDALVSVRFLDQRFQGKRAVTDPARIAADRLLRAIAGRPTLRMVYFYGPEHPIVWWRDDQIDEALGECSRAPGGSTEVVVYPGLKRWVDAAKSLLDRLKERDARVGEP